MVSGWRRQIRAGQDPLGRSFCEIRPAAQRRSLGAFYTQSALLEPMVEWTLARRPTRVVDAGCGSGRFAAAVARARDVELVAVDIDPVATLSTRAVLASLGAAGRVLHADYTRLELPEHDGVTAFIGNPPYVRHHELASELKSWARGAARALGIRSSALAGLHAYFYLATARLARAGDIGCFVTSAEWLDIGYGSMIRDLLSGPLGAHALHVLDPEAVAFDDAMTTAAIACFEVGARTPSVFLASAAQPSDLRELGRGRPVRRPRLAAANRWTPLVKGKKAVSHEAVLGDVARVHRGVVTGSNSFFVLSPERAAELGIASFCRPAITSARQILDADGQVRLDARTKVLLDLQADLCIEEHPRLAAYLASGAAEGVDQGYVASHRQPWWRVGVGAPPPIVASYMARQPPVFALNPDGLVLLNIAHGIYPKKKLSKKALAELVAALNANRQRYKGSGRTYHGGLEKFEPKEMEALPIPAVIAGES